MNVLIVEDDWATYHDISCRLNSEFDVLPQASSVREAQDYIKQYNPEAILLDIELQESSCGIELGLRLSGRQKSYIIFMSNHDDTQTLERLAHVKHSHFVSKLEANYVENIKRNLTIHSCSLMHGTDNPTHDAKEIIMLTPFFTRNAEEVTPQNKGKVLVHYKDIIFIETDLDKKNYLIVHTATGQYNLLETVKDFVCRKPFFIQSKSSSAINGRHIKRLHMDSSVTVGPFRVHIGKTYRKAIKDYLSTISD